MSRQSTPGPAKFRMAATIALLLAGAFVSASAIAKVVRNTVDPIASVADNGRKLTLTGPIECEHGQSSDLRLTVTQRSTGAEAEGHGLVVCTGGVQQWEVSAATRGRKTFAPGPAVAVAVATTFARGETDDAHQWLVNITLVSE